MFNITVVVHTFNEEGNIEDCINSAKLLTGEIILIDMESTDRTSEIAKSLNVPVFNFPKSNYVEPAREFGISKSRTDWVLILDADERMTKELAKEITNIISVGNDPRVVPKTYYKIPRKNIFAGIKWLRYGGWWPDYQIRLINKKYFINWPKRIHSTPKIKGNFGYIKNSLIHYFHEDLSSMVKKTVIFEDIESDLLYKAGKKTTTRTFFRKFLSELYRRLIKNFGFLDETFGVIESIYQAFSKTFTYLFLYEKSRLKKN
ncbi:MAG: glycosyltransferase family 2 protein [Patescibacteria group bacterium]